MTVCLWKTKNPVCLKELGFKVYVKKQINILDNQIKSIQVIFCFYQKVYYLCKKIIMKICKRCGSDSNGYYPQLRNKDGLRPYCKVCDKAQSKITYHKNKALLKLRKLRAK